MANYLGGSMLDIDNIAATLPHIPSPHDSYMVTLLAELKLARQVVQHARELAWRRPKLYAALEAYDNITRG